MRLAREKISTHCVPSHRKIPSGNSDRISGLELSSKLSEGAECKAEISGTRECMCQYMTAVPLNSNAAIGVLGKLGGSGWI